MGKSEQAVAQDRRLFSFRNGDGKVAYPTAQFDGRSVVGGVQQVAEIRTRLLEAGTGTPVLFVHGNLSIADRVPLLGLRQGK